MERTASLVVSALLAIGFGNAVAHGGGLNQDGCHNNRKTGDYHCHRAPSVEPAVTQPAPALPAQTSGAKPPAASRVPRPATPTCYTGPRGGTYTITPSGKKNYGGC